ncbi:MAG: hypothetical protein KGI81_00045 [Betaproteobacteria bacterium]|nr:hypothetical protein [Betaproteobacteria bacterium]
MRSIRPFLVILLSLALALPAGAALPMGFAQPHCQGMEASAPIMAPHHAHAGKMAPAGSSCCLGDHCERSCAAPVVLPVVMLPPALPVATPQRIAFFQSFIPSAAPTGVWRPPRRS